MSDGADRLAERKGVPVEPTGDDCPVCPEGELVKPRSELPQCPRCHHVEGGTYVDHELADFALTYRQARRLLDLFGYPTHGTPGDIGTRLWRLADDLDVDRTDLSEFCADLRGTHGYERGEDS